MPPLIEKYKTTILMITCVCLLLLTIYCIRKQWTLQAQHDQLSHAFTQLVQQQPVHQQRRPPLAVPKKVHAQPVAAQCPMPLVPRPASPDVQEPLPSSYEPTPEPQMEEDDVSSDDASLDKELAAELSKLSLDTIIEEEPQDYHESPLQLTEAVQETPPPLEAVPFDE